jgi:hypothetical protein
MVSTLNMTPISAGTPLQAPSGYLSLEVGVIYYFIRSSPESLSVVMVRFVQRKAEQKTYQSQKRPVRLVTPQPIPIVERMRRAEFEEGLKFGKIRPGERKAMPPWLQELEGQDLTLHEFDRRGAAKPHAERIDQKLFSIGALLTHGNNLLDCDDIESRINKHARSLTPPQNETRVRLWYFTYIAFGLSRDVLHYPIHRIGHWSRLENKSNVKRGAPGHKGAGHGYNTTEKMQQLIIDSYRRECGLGVTETDIYTSAMRKDFGCRSRWTDGGKKVLELFHPLGEPFPTQATYFYHVRCHFDPMNMKSIRAGRNRSRSKWQATLGTFTEHCWNLMQRVESDGYRVQRLPKGYVEGSDLPALVVVTKRDSASGKKTGIGFSQGSEVGAAYRMATFCEAIGLEAYARFYGVNIRNKSGLGKGLAANEIRDRGPGATPTGLSRDAELLPVNRELTPAHSGQSKAMVETSNPKTPSNDEAPNFLRSDRTVVQLARDEIFALLKFNETTNVASRIDPAIAELVARPSPNGVWDALESLGRNDAVQVSFEEAVRAFLDIAPATLKREGVELAGRNYHSKTRAFQHALESAAANGGVPVRVYVLTACIRHIWFDWKNRLIELDVRYPVPVETEVRYMSMAEAVEYNEYRKRRDREFSEHKQAAAVEMAEDYEEQTGLKLSRGQRTAGRPKRGNAIARQEAAEAARGAAGKKAT